MVGASGIGKSTLVSLLSGAHTPDQGVVSVKARLGIFKQFEERPPLVIGEYLESLWDGVEHQKLLAQLLEQLPFERPLMNLSGGEWVKVRLAKLLNLDQSYGLFNPERDLLSQLKECSGIRVEELRNELSFFGFTKDKAFQLVKSLSGGELLRANLARLFITDVKPSLLLLDEPSNNLDLQSQELLILALRRFNGALVMVTHDEHLAGALTFDHQIVLAQPRYKSFSP